MTKLISQLTKLGQRLVQVVQELANAGVILERRYLQFKNEQRQDDGENAVAERLDAGEPQFAAAEAIKQTHVGPEDYSCISGRICKRDTTQERREFRKLE
jgi:hypothetical protein